MDSISDRNVNIRNQYLISFFLLTFSVESILLSIARILWETSNSFLFFNLDRCLSLHFLHWKQHYGKLSRTKYYIGTLTIICLLLNSHILLFNGYRADSVVKCYATRTNPHYIFPQWERVHLVVYNLCPFTTMLFCNTYIISITVRSARIRSSTQRKGSANARRRQLSLMLLIVTFAFVLLTLPSCIYFVFFRHRMPSDESSKTYRYMVQICLSSIQFTSHAINFFLYCFSATNFRQELHDFISELFCGRILTSRAKSTMSTETVRFTTVRRQTSNEPGQKHRSLVQTKSSSKTNNDPESAVVFACDNENN